MTLLRCFTGYLKGFGAASRASLKQGETEAKTQLT